ncbi:Hemimethylated DNA-binding protein YccV like-domain-containing protein [Lentinula raphanica]|nr:Hemimethylated DNA-binding protein YccV like-domain-containing protein [Lentinula raphanica]
MVHSLPLDVLVHILFQLTPSRSPDGEIAVKTIARFSVASVLFQEAAAFPSLWQQHYQARYLHANEQSEEQRKAETNGNWKLMYAARRAIDMEVIEHLQSIVTKRVGRYDHVNASTKFLFDAWDVLEIARGVASPSEHMEIRDASESHTLMATRSYWASALLVSIGQTYAVNLWASLRSGNNSVSFVQAFSSTSCFFGKHMDEMNSILYSLSSRCKEYLLRLNFPLSKLDSDSDLKKLCVLICKFMESEGYGPVSAFNFHDLLNLFPHCYLTSHKRTIPLSLAHIFVSIAQSLGVAASPVDFPIRVLVHISTPDPKLDDFYVDVFGVQPILTLREDIPALLARQAIPVANMLHYISPSGAAPMLLRDSRNILSSLNITNTSLSLIRSSALLALTIFLLLTGGAQVVHQLVLHAEPLDCATFIAEALIPALDGTGRAQNDLRQGCQRTLDEEINTAQEIKSRSSEDGRVVRHFVGMLFEHRKYSYIGLITGWDSVCQASESWLREMEVPDLPRGRIQPFYHIVCLDNSSRYVAEDNIQPLLTSSHETLKGLCQNIDILPKLFVGVVTRWTDWPKEEEAPAQERLRARFVLSPELREKYPGDEALGDDWLNGRYHPL